MTNETHLLRQVNPNWIQQGRPSSQTFTPTPKDEGILSVYHGDLVDAEKSWRHYTDEQKLKSAGVLSVTVAECVAEKVEPLHDAKPFAEHASIDFTKLESKNAVKRAGSSLSKVAVARGWLYQPET